MGVFPKCQDTEAVSHYRGWILRGPHFQTEYVIMSQQDLPISNATYCYILQFTI